MTNYIQYMGFGESSVVLKRQMADKIAEYLTGIGLVSEREGVGVALSRASIRSRFKKKGYDTYVIGFVARRLQSEFGVSVRVSEEFSDCHVILFE